jgi:hypothetical protein
MAGEVVFEGMDKLARLLQVGGSNAEKATGKALYQEATVMFNESQAEVPVMYGILKASGQVSLPMYEGHSVEVDIGYGGAASEYALEVHENLAAHHPHGKAKYLEDPVMRHVDSLLKRVAARVDEAMRAST